jgi:hypothetical protein
MAQTLRNGRHPRARRWRCDPASAAALTRGA